MTAGHICVTVAFTLTQSELLFVRDKTQYYRMYSAFIFFGGAADLFLSMMIWFILDGDKAPLIVVVGDRAYAVEDIIRKNDSTINSNCDDHVE